MYVCVYTNHVNLIVYTDMLHMLQIVYVCMFTAVAHHFFGDFGPGFNRGLPEVVDGVQDLSHHALA